MNMWFAISYFMHLSTIGCHIFYGVKSIDNKQTTLSSAVKHDRGSIYYLLSI